MDAPTKKPCRCTLNRKGNKTKCSTDTQINICKKACFIVVHKVFHDKTTKGHIRVESGPSEEY